MTLQYHYSGINKYQKNTNPKLVSGVLDKRPKGINNRSIVGHEEIETVYSGKECSSTYLLNLSERKTGA